MNAEKAIRERDRLQEALMQVERVAWREGEQLNERLVECRKIAREALETIAPD